MFFSHILPSSLPKTWLPRVALCQAVNLLFSCVSCFLFIGSLSNLVPFFFHKLFLLEFSPRDLCLSLFNLGPILSSSFQRPHVALDATFSFVSTCYHFPWPLTFIIKPCFYFILLLSFLSLCYMFLKSCHKIAIVTCFNQCRMNLILCSKSWHVFNNRGTILLSSKSTIFLVFFPV